MAGKTIRLMNVDYIVTSDNLEIDLNNITSSSSAINTSIDVDGHSNETPNTYSFSMGWKYNSGGGTLNGTFVKINLMNAQYINTLHSHDGAGHCGSNNEVVLGLSYSGGSVHGVRFGVSDDSMDVTWGNYNAPTDGNPHACSNTFSDGFSHYVPHDETRIQKQSFTDASQSSNWGTFGGAKTMAGYCSNENEFMRLMGNTGHLPSTSSPTTSKGLHADNSVNISWGSANTSYYNNAMSNGTEAFSLGGWGPSDASNGQTAKVSFLSNASSTSISGSPAGAYIGHSSHGSKGMLIGGVSGPGNGITAVNSIALISLEGSNSISGSWMTLSAATGGAQACASY